MVARRTIEPAALKYGGTCATSVHAVAVVGREFVQWSAHLLWVMGWVKVLLMLVLLLPRLLAAVDVLLRVADRQPVRVQLHRQIASSLAAANNSHTQTLVSRKKLILCASFNRPDFHRL